MVDYRTARIIVVAAYVLAGVYAVHAALPRTPIRLPFERRVGFELLLPEKWGFFTRDPREEGATIEVNGRAEVVRRPLNPVRRDDRTRGLEIGFLMASVAPNDWMPCTPDACVPPAAPTRSVSNIASNPRFCGDVRIILRKPVPFAFRKLTAKVDVPGRQARLHVRCDAHDDR